MNLTIDRAHGVTIVRVNDTRLHYALLAGFTHDITTLLATGDTRLLIDLSAVASLDSAAVGCLVDLTRQAQAAGGVLKLTGVQKRAAAMLEMTGAQQALDIQPDESAGIRSFD